MNLFQWRCLYHKNNFDLERIGIHVDDYPKTRLPYLDYDSVSQFHCGSCPFYTGVQCHGHGEFWGNCSLLDNARKILSSISNIPSFKFYLKNTKFLMEEICYDDSECRIFKIVK